MFLGTGVKAVSYTHLDVYKRQDKDSGEIVNGYVTGLKNVTVVPHAHDCRWNTETHEKSCVCGYAETTDSDAPVISGIENGKTYYGAAEFSVADANEMCIRDSP